MKLFDSHCHLNDPVFRKDFDHILQRMQEAEVAAVMIVGIDAENSRSAVQLARTRPEFYAAVGAHPHDAKSCSDEHFETLRELASHPEVRAIGETGLDFNRMYSPPEDQEKWFLRHLELADEMNLPLIFHERDSGGRFLELLKGNHRPKRQGVIHCFSGNRSELEWYLALGYHIGITGILTHQTRGQELRRQVQHIPADRILIETDAPYLTPAPHKNRTRRNEPAFVRATLLKLAEVRGEDPEELSAILWENTCRLFRISLD